MTDDSNTLPPPPSYGPVPLITERPGAIPCTPFSTPTPPAPDGFTSPHASAAEAWRTAVQGLPA